MRKLYVLRRWKVVLAILATLLVAACSTQTPTTGSIGVNNSTAHNWIIYVDTLVAGTVAAGSSTTIGNLNPGVHAVSGSTPPADHRTSAVGNGRCGADGLGLLVTAPAAYRTPSSRKIAVRPAPPPPFGSLKERQNHRHPKCHVATNAQYMIARS